MKGTLIKDNSDPVAAKWPPGAYGFHCGVPFAITPNGHLANLAAHSVTENEYGRWNVTPSILVRGSEVVAYHGWLKDGVWRDA